jgi:hypothetical protein
VATIYSTLGGSPLTLGAPSLSTWCALLLLALLSQAIKSSTLPFAKLVGALVKLLVGCIVIYHSHWNKKGFEGYYMV